MHTLFLATLLAVASFPAGAQQSRPSFDCRKAASEVEKAICANPGLGALDRRVAQAYAAALKRLDAKGAEALRADQRSFQATLSYGLEWDEGKPKDKRIFNLAASLKGRADLLASLGPAPTGQWAGTWSNHFGAIEIRRDGNGGKLMVSANGAMPVTGNWVCTIEGPAETESDRLIVRGDEDGKPDGWAYRLTRDGDRLEFAQQGPKGERHGSPTCGRNGSMEGSYLFVAKPISR